MGVKVSDGLNGDEWFVSNQNVLGYRDSDGVGEWMEGGYALFVQWVEEHVMDEVISWGCECDVVLLLDIECVMEFGGWFVYIGMLDVVLVQGRELCCITGVMRVQNDGAWSDW